MPFLDHRGAGLFGLEPEVELARMVPARRLGLRGERASGRGR